MMNKKKLWWLISGAFALALCLLIGFGFYPVALVNGSIISARELNKNISAFMEYGSKAQVVYGTSTLPEVRVSAGDILNQLIETTLIRDGLIKELGSPLYKRLLDEKNKSYVGDRVFMTAAESVYGLSAGDVVSEIIRPQAEKELLLAHLSLNQTNFPGWLLGEKKAADVRVFLSGVRWTGEVVESNK